MATVKVTIDRNARRRLEALKRKAPKAFADALCKEAQAMLDEQMRYLPYLSLMYRLSKITSP
jgi:hypothetical protein